MKSLELINAFAKSLGYGTNNTFSVLPEPLKYCVELEKGESGFFKEFSESAIFVKTDAKGVFTFNISTKEAWFEIENLTAKEAESFVVMQRFGFTAQKFIETLGDHPNADFADDEALSQ